MHDHPAGVLDVVHPHAIEVRVAQFGFGRAQRDQPPVQIQNLGVRGSLDLGPVQHGLVIGTRILRVDHVGDVPAMS